MSGDRCQGDRCRRSVSKTLLPRTSSPMTITPQCYSKLRTLEGHRQWVGRSAPPTFRQPASSPRLARDFNGTLIHRRRLLSRSPLRQRSQPHLKLELQFLDKARLAPSGHPVRARRCARSLLLTKPLPLSSRRRGGCARGSPFLLHRSWPYPVCCQDLTALSSGDRGKRVFDTDLFAMLGCSITPLM